MSFDLLKHLLDACRANGTKSNAIRAIRDEFIRLHGRDACIAAGFVEAVSTLAGGKDLVKPMLDPVNLTMDDVNTHGALWSGRLRDEIRTPAEREAIKAEKKAKKEKIEAEKKAANEGTGLALDGASGSIVITDPCLALRSCWDSAIASGLTVKELLEGSGLMSTVEGFFTLSAIA